MIGGIGRHTYLMYSELKGADLLFFSPAQNQLPRHIPINFALVRFLKQVGVSIWLHLNALRIIAQHDLDKLNIHTGPGGVLLVRKLPVPVIVTCHHTYRQQCRYIKRQFWKALFLPFEKRTYRLASRIVAVSEATKRALVDDYGIPEAKIVTVANAIDGTKFGPEAVAKGSRTLVYVGRIDKRKGIDFLINSMPLVRERFPDVLLLVGGKGAYLDSMKALVRRLGVESNVKFLGFVPDAELNALYNRGQCVVVPSIFEGFGITIIEALAAGTRVIGSDTDGIQEILRQPGYGELVPYGDTQALAAAIVRELENPRQAAALRPEYLTGSFTSGYRAVLEESST